MPWEDREVSWSIRDVGALLLDSIARGLYSKLEVFREYVQNAVDSYADFQSLTGLTADNTVQVWIDADNTTLHIRDGGVGMDWSDVNTAKSIAVSPKLLRANDFVGFRGLGIWSGLSACEQLVMTTTKVGNPCRFRLTIDCKDIVEHLEDPVSIDELLMGRFRIEQSDYDQNDHFTHVKLVNVHKNSYGDLLNKSAIIRFSEQYLPVPFDPAWDFTETLVPYLKPYPWTTTYPLTINGEPVYRRFPSKVDIKKPEIQPIVDRHGRQVAVGWWCETNRRGTTKRLDSNPKEGLTPNFTVRVKNFAIGQRGLYSDQDVPDKDNLDWFVGEIYVTDTNIRPDTKRTHFQPSPRYDDVVCALRQFYTSVALRARAWSAQVTTEDACDRVEELEAEINGILTETTENSEEKQARLADPLGRLETAYQKLVDARKEANKVDLPDDTAARTLILRNYLRRPDTKGRLETAIGKVTALKGRVQQALPDGGTHQPTNAVETGVRRRRSRARTSTLALEQIPPSIALGTHAIVGELPGEQKTIESNETGEQTVELSVAVSAFRAAAAGVLGEEAESFRRIMDRLTTELRRRGVNV